MQRGKAPSCCSWQGFLHMGVMGEEHHGAMDVHWHTSPAERHASNETLHCVMGLGPFHQQQPKANCPLMCVL